MLGQLTNVDPQHLKDFLIISAVIAAIVIPIVFGIRAATRKRTQVEPDPLRVEAVQKFVTPEMCSAQHESICARVEALEKSALEGVDRRRAIYEKIAQVEAAARADNNELRKNVFAEIARLTERIEDIPDRLIATLSNLGFLGKGKDKS